jgi:hypothetical protein
VQNNLTLQTWPRSLAGRIVSWIQPHLCILLILRYPFRVYGCLTTVGCNQTVLIHTILIFTSTQLLRPIDASISFILKPMITTKLAAFTLLKIETFCKQVILWISRVNVRPSIRVKVLENRVFCDKFNANPGDSARMRADKRQATLDRASATIGKKSWSKTETRQMVLALWI